MMKEIDSPSVNQEPGAKGGQVNITSALRKYYEDAVTIANGGKCQCATY
jgi:hypothetical protein